MFHRPFEVAGDLGMGKRVGEAGESNRRLLEKAEDMDWFGRDGHIGLAFVLFVLTVVLLLIGACCIFKWRKRNRSGPTSFSGWGSEGEKEECGEVYSLGTIGNESVVGSSLLVKSELS